MRPEPEKCGSCGHDKLHLPHRCAPSLETDAHLATMLAGMEDREKRYMEDEASVPERWAVRLPRCRAINWLKELIELRERAGRRVYGWNDPEAGKAAL